MNLKFRYLFLFIIFLIGFYYPLEARKQKDYIYNPYRDKYHFFISAFAYISNNQQQNEGLEIMFRVISPLQIGFSYYKANLLNDQFIFSQYDLWNKSQKSLFSLSKRNPSMSSFKMRYFPFEGFFYLGTSLRSSENYQEDYLEIYSLQPQYSYNINFSLENSFFYKKNFGNLYGISFDIGLFSIYPQKWWDKIEFGLIHFFEISYQKYYPSKNQIFTKEFFYLELITRESQLNFIKEPLLLVNKLEYLKNQKSIFFHNENISFNIGIGIAY